MSKKNSAQSLDPAERKAGLAMREDNGPKVDDGPVEGFLMFSVNHDCPHLADWELHRFA